MDRKKVDWSTKLANGLRYFHLVMTFVWGILLIPTLLWWRQSVLWVALMSVWANLASHFSAWQASRGEKRAMDNED